MVRHIQVTSVLNKTKRRDPWFLDDYTINPWSGCAFGCLFCYIRGSKYGEHMADKLSIKANLPQILEKQFWNRAKKGQHGVVVVSSATDPYLPIEEGLRLTRTILELALKYRFPVHIITRGNLVLRDVELLLKIKKEAILPSDLKQRNCPGAFVTFSFSTIDPFIAHIFEPGAPLPSTRLSAMAEVSRAGLLTGASLMPLLPWITDTAAHLDAMFKSIKASGARYIFPATLTLFGNDPGSSKSMIFKAISKHYPVLLAKYERLFAHGYQLPAHYRQAFHSKAMELCANHSIRHSVLE